MIEMRPRFKRPRCYPQSIEHCVYISEQRTGHLMLGRGNGSHYYYSEQLPSFGCLYLSIRPLVSLRYQTTVHPQRTRARGYARAASPMERPSLIGWQGLANKTDWRAMMSQALLTSSSRIFQHARAILQALLVAGIAWNHCATGPDLARVPAYCHQRRSFGLVRGNWLPLVIAKIAWEMTLAGVAVPFECERNQGSPAIFRSFSPPSYLSY